MKKQLYLFSGLGADHRTFQRLNLSDFEVTHIQWLEPIPGETIGQYADRLLPQINKPRPVLIGLSFGGLVSIEVAKKIPTGRVILISSIKTRKEIPFYLRWIGLCRVHKLIPVSFLRRTNLLTYWFFGVQAPSDKKLLKQIIKDTDSTFVKWAIDQLLRWRNETIPSDLYHIHGSKDRLLPAKYIKGYSNVSGGGHWMVMDKAEEVNRQLFQMIEGVA